MGDQVQSFVPVTAKELQRLARQIERDAILRRKLLAKVADLEASIRSARRLFAQLVERVALDGATAPTPDRGEDVP